MRNEAGPRRPLWDPQAEYPPRQRRTNHFVTDEDYGLRKQRSEDLPRVHASDPVNLQGNRDYRRRLPIGHDRFGDDLELGPEMVLQPETRPISHEQLVVEVKGIYAGLVLVEAKCIDIDERQEAACRSRVNELHAEFRVIAAQESKEPIWTIHVLRFAKRAADKVSESFLNSLRLPKAAFVNKALPMLIKGRKIEARHDTGAEGSNFITTSLVKELGLDIRTDKSDSKAFKTATGTVMRAIGKAKAMCAFAQDSETKLKCWFHVFEKLPSPLIMGAQFLEKTKTMSDFTSRLVDRPLCADLMPMVDLIASTNQTKRRLAAHVDGRYTCINADSGSQLDVMSSTYARAHGYKLNRGRQYRKRVLLADATKADTIGQVTADVTLKDGSSYCTTFDVLPGLISDVILGESTLDHMNAFTIYQSSFVNVFCGERYHELCLLSYLGKLNEYSLRLTRRKYRTQQQASPAKQHDDRMMESMYEKDLEAEALERERRRAAAAAAGQEAQRNSRDLAAGEGERSNVQASQYPAAISARTTKRRRIGNSKFFEAIIKHSNILHLMILMRLSSVGLEVLALARSSQFNFLSGKHPPLSRHVHNHRRRLRLMRPLLQRLLATPFPTSIFRDLSHPGNYSICQRYSHGVSSWDHVQGAGRDSPKVKEIIKRNGSKSLGTLDYPLIRQLAKTEEASGSSEHGVEHPQHAVARVQQQEEKALISKPRLSPRALNKKLQWLQHLSTFEQYQKESDLDASHTGRPFLVKDERYATDWKLWLELIRFRRRHHGTKGTQTLYREIFQRDMSMPTSGGVGKELWDTLMMVAYEEPKFLREVVAYAIKLKRTTGEGWPRLYYSVVVCGLKKDPGLAYSLHVRLKEDFPPSLVDYQKLFHRSTAMDDLNAFERVYRDLPILGIYGTIVPELCRLLNNRDAIKWHTLLFSLLDVPSDFKEIKPLLGYLAHIGDDRRIEQIVKDLKEAYGEITPVPLATEKFVRERPSISREIFNRQLGEVHGVAPKHLSDNFCARLFATRLFSIETIISGLHMMGVESIGPLSMREIVSRDKYHPSNFTRHLDRLKDAGISPDESAFSLLIQKLAWSDEQRLLRSVVECDLHPDTFEDADVQERLLAEYYEKDDQLLIERTLAAITVRCREQDLAKWRWNLTLRSHVKLGRINAVKSILEIMKQQGVPVTTRSSRHLRVCWLSKRRVGRAAHSTKELSVIINATQSTMLSGRYVPITAWKEVMRRLGMAGRLPEFENLAFWLVDHYTSPVGMSSMPSRILVELKTDSDLGSNSNPQAFLKTLFTIAAQHAIVAWGFQQAVKCPPGAFRRVQMSSGVLNRQRPLWVWGLVLLRNLQQRGVPIHRSTVAKICTHRLDTLFGRGISKSRINRQSRALDRHALAFYVRGMKKIWGDGLFRQTGTPELEARLA